ncbi:MAG: two-component system response regulator AtoC [Pirellulaceae bacterium]|jgi:two-component system response regulator AtoC
MLLRLLLAVEPAGLQTRLHRLLKEETVVVKKGPTSTGPLIRELQRESYDLVVVSESSLVKSEQDVVAAINALQEPPEIVVVSEVDDAEQHARLLAAGCFLVLNSGLLDNVLSEAFAAVLIRRRDTIDKSIASQRSTGIPQLSDFVSASPAMQAFINVARRVAPSDASLLITGETGVGKERLARAIHAEGPRSGGPFVAVNCGALPETLLESELFGHEEGAFTGAARARRGWFELSHGGTIFLDEIGEMPLHLQVKLLHVLQNHEVKRLGSERSIEVDVRVIAATNRELLAEIDNGRFRRDLYYRLGVINLSIPPLRERREDIPALVGDYISRFRTMIGRDVNSIEDDALEGLVNYSWPGNVRELINVIERAVLLCESGVIGAADLPDQIAESKVPAIPSRPDSDLFPVQLLDQPIREARQVLVSEFEKAYLTRLLELTNGRVGETARRAGIEPRSLFEKMRRYGLRKEDFRRRDR